MKRRKMGRKASKRSFTKYAMKSPKANFQPARMRGGRRLA